MKLNIFRVAAEDIPSMLTRFGDVGLDLVHSSTDSGWQRRLYFSSDPDPAVPKWLEPLLPLFEEGERPETVSFYAAFVFTKASRCYVLSYGKSHFYIRPYADYDFGMDLGKRIANHKEARHLATRRYQGSRRKDIKSFTPGTRLDAESGESVEFLELAIADEVVSTFGKVGKFGTSAQLNVPKLAVSRLGSFFDAIDATLKQGELFKVPRTTIIKDQADVDAFNAQLISELRQPIGETSIASVAGAETFDLWGVDFIFPSSVYSYELRGPGRNHERLDELTVGHLKHYISTRKLSDEEILRLRVRFHPDEGAEYTQSLLHVLDYVMGKNLTLTQGRWMRFNQDYLDNLNGYLDDIEVEVAEETLATVSGKEGDFNASDAVAAEGYANGDKNFAILKTRASTPIEAYDLWRDDTLYAVKFGTSPKLGYTCDQMVNVLEILRNEADAKNNLPDFKRICLWFGYKGVNPLPRISKSSSIILKQKLDHWARATRGMGYTPVIKLSHHDQKYSN